MRYYEILCEAKEITDARHEESTLKHWGSSKYNYIKPSDGFFFTYRGGLLVLHSEENEVYSSKVSGVKIPEVWNGLGGKVDLTTKTITISKESVRTTTRQRAITDVKELQKVLKDLFQFGVRKDFVVKGTPKHIPNTVAKILALKDPTDEILNQKPIVMYHGTSLKNWKIIQKEGLRPGKTVEQYYDLIPGYSENNVYLATTEKAAEFYGKRQAKKDRDSGYVALQINVPDPAKLASDDYFATAFNNGEVDLDRVKKRSVSKYSLTASGRELGQYAYSGIILPTHISVAKVGKI